MEPSFHGEVMLAGWSESHNGGCKVTFWLSDAADLEAFRAATVKKGNTAGQRYAAALVEIGDDEQPVIGKTISESNQTPKGGLLSKLAASLCRNVVFQEWCGCESEEDAADHVRTVCGIESRAELDHNEEAARKFHRELRVPYLARV